MNEKELFADNYYYYSYYYYMGSCVCACMFVCTITTVSTFYCHLGGVGTFSMLLVLLYQDFGTCVLGFWYLCTRILVLLYQDFGTCVLGFWYLCTRILVLVYQDFGTCVLGFWYFCTRILVLVYQDFGTCVLGFSVLRIQGCWVASTKCQHLVACSVYLILSLVQNKTEGSCQSGFIVNELIFKAK